jgi:hypothetical protein
MNPTLDHIGYNVFNLPQAREFYYGAFVIGPDGHNIEAVCHRPE